MRLRHQTGFAELRGELHTDFLGNRFPRREQRRQDRAGLVIPVQHREQANAKRQVRRLGAGALEGSHRPWVVQQADVRLGPEPEQGWVRPRRPGRIEDIEHAGEVLFAEPLPHLHEQQRVRLRARDQEDEGECFHGR